jgi:hypothetical protein
VAWYVRIGFRPDRWLNLPWLPANEVQADATKDFSRIKDNELSVFLVNSQADGIRAAIAIASRVEQQGAVGYALFDADAIAALGITPQKTEGETPDAEVNTWHYELRELTFSRLSEIAKIVKQGLVEDIPLPAFKARVQAEVAGGHLDEKQVNRRNLVQ